MKKVIGYILALLGLIGLAVNSTAGRKVFPAIEGISSNIVLIVSLVMILIGVIIVLLLSKTIRKLSQSDKEVPIYKGEGKKRKIVGYRAE